MRRTRRASFYALLAASLLALGCDDGPRAAAGPDPLALVLAPMPGDPEIARWQQRVRRDPGGAPPLERLGWAFVERARSSEDPGYYALAEQTARALASLDRRASALLRARALHGQHRFAEAERAARSLIREDAGPFAWAVLGDALFDQGRVDEAAAAYERMMALRPDSQALARFAEVLFVRGDLLAATEAMRRSARSIGPRSAGAYAWTRARLATFLLHRGALDPAEAIARDGLRRAPESVDALFALGRVQLARERYDAAAATLERAAERSGRPRMLWALAEALRAGGREARAREVEARLLENGARADGRGFALYLASRGEDPQRALALARAEVAQRRDVFSLATLAWCELAAGQPDVAFARMRRALAHGTRDAGLDLRAGVIALRAGAPDQAARWLRLARKGHHLLLPSERERLAAAEQALSRDRGQVARPVPHPSTIGETT